MLSAIGSTTSSYAAGTGQSAAALQAQLDRYQQQLSDCVNCSSAKTREGQQAILDLSNKIGQVKTQLNEATISKPAISNTSTSASITVNKNNLPPHLGQHIDVKA